MSSSRRRFLSAAALCALLPRPAAAAKPWRIGIFDTHARGHDDGIAERLVKAMRERGYVEGRDIEYVHRHAAGGTWEFHRIQTAAIANELVRARLDAIVTAGTAATRALQRVTTTIPIVTNAGDPIGAGFAKSLVRPGGNITGLALAMPEIHGKALQYLKSIIPGDWTLAVAYWDGAGDSQKSLISAVEEGARACGIPTRTVSFKDMDARQADRTLASMRGQGIRALGAFTPIAGIPDEGYDLLMATKYGLATAPAGEYDVVKGALLSYGPDGEGTEDRKAFQLVRILRGTPPGEIPWKTPTNYRLTINRTTAKILGLNIPREVMILVDKVYE